MTSSTSTLGLPVPQRRLPRSVGPRRYVPLESVEPTRDQVRPPACTASREIVSCPTCDRSVSGAHVIHGKPIFNAEHRTPALVRSAYCPHCRHVWHWLQACNDIGERLGLVLSGPGLMRTPRLVERWLAKHPTAAGVEE
jgi:primosomal protein N'